MVAITGQVTTKLIGSDAFQEADTFGITRSCTKHNFLVKNLADLPQVVHEAFHIAASGRPGPVLVDIPRTCSGQAHYTPVTSIHLPGYKVYHRRPHRADPARGADDLGSQAAVRVRGRRHHRGRSAAKNCANWWS
jgi:thiamine pyrophosphate-dependent acetolactate synthase large subunit-like protein